MEIFGNVEALKGAIEKKYVSKIKEVEKEKGKELKEIEKELTNKLELLRSHMKTATDAEVKKAHSMILSAEKLKAKKEFEEKRESIILSVFKEAEKRAKEIAHTEEYLDFVAKDMPEEKKTAIVGDDKYYKTAYPKMKVRKGIIGLKFESKDVTYDFTLDNLISSKRDVLRQEVSKVLFS